MIFLNKEQTRLIECNDIFVNPYSLPVYVKTSHSLLLVNQILVYHMV